MTDKNIGSNRNVKNPLFTASVTGSTFEDFSQNALLLPIQLSHEPPENPTVDNGNFIQPPVILSESNQYQDPPVFSTFSNTINVQDNINPATENVFVPVYRTSSPLTVNRPLPTSNFPPQIPQGSISSYRRIGSKRPAYAQVPGLVSSQAPVAPFSPTQPPVPFSQPDPKISQFNKPITETPFASASPFLNAIPQLEIFTPASTILNPVEFACTAPNLYASDASSDAAVNTVLNQSNNPLTSVISSTTFLNSIMSSSSDNSTGGSSFSGFAQKPDENVFQTSANGLASSLTYRPVYHHWFHKKVIETKIIWQPFSMVDSLALEDAFTSPDMSPETVVATDGGRYDVNILRRERISVYWISPASEVRRCSWFHKGNNDGRFVPYEENVATKLEEEYKIAFESNIWQRRVVLSNSDTVVFHGPDVLVLFSPSQTVDSWGNVPQNQVKPKIVKRGMDEFDIDEGEPQQIDHLLFLVHGIGSVCDLKFRSVQEVVDDFRSISLQLVRSHYRSSCDRGIANRIEVLPISWHSQLHSDDTGIDKQLKSITLESIPRLRDFTNDTLLDILFYTSPIYCQTIISTVGNEMNRLHQLFKERNPTFTGGVSVGGHSLGSLILFDLLCHQKSEIETDKSNQEEDAVCTTQAGGESARKKKQLSRRISYMMGTIGTGQPQLHYPHLSFKPLSFFALGSPIGMFVTIRGLDNLGEDFTFPTCPSFFNIFHPYDPVAYRVESLINSQLADLKPVLIPHHKGRKRMHLELKETMAKVGADLKQKLIDSMKSTWNSFFQLATFQRLGGNNRPSLEAEVNKVLEEELQREAQIPSTDDEYITTNNETETNLPLGKLNAGRRIDYVLQEAPFEFFNEYIFALTSHVCYWESEDTMLLILKEIYNSLEIPADSKIPQQTMTVERPLAVPKYPGTSKLPSDVADESKGMDPTLPMSSQVNIGPPPVTGFVKK